MVYPYDLERENDIIPPLNFTPDHTLETLPDKIEIGCLKCDKIYEFPKDRDQYLADLFLEHRLVIADVEDILQLEEYLKYWQSKFKEQEFEMYCTTMLLDQLPDGTPAKDEKYYLLSDIVPEDFELRKRLQQESLEKALERHQYERTDRTFCKSCLYCRDVIKGLRSDYIKHLFKKHFLQLGKPENLVYVDELIAKVQRNLDQFVCLYCEKVFKDRVVLKEHMRKKTHKRINPNNRSYDKFFLINYRGNNDKCKHYLNKKPVQRQQETAGSVDKAAVTRQVQKYAKALPQREQPARERSVDFEKRKSAAHSDDSDSEWSDWADGEQQLLNCLFCAHKTGQLEELNAHMLQEHAVDFAGTLRELNFYQKIKIVNYVRRQVFLRRCLGCEERCDTAEQLLQHMTQTEHFSLGTREQWDKPEHYFSTYEDDGLLYVLDDSASDDSEVGAVPVIAEQPTVEINKEAERLALENADARVNLL